MWNLIADILEIILPIIGGIIFGFGLRGIYDETVGA